MNLQTQKSTLFFIGAFILTLFVPSLFPSIKVAFFSPPLIGLFYKKPLSSCLWASLFCGLILDLLSPQARMGLNELCFVLTTVLLYRQRRHFFADSFSTLPLMTFFYSSLSSLIYFILIKIFDQGVPFLKVWIVKDLLLMPLIDAGFAFIVGVLPFLLFGKPNRKGKDYFMGKNK